MRYFSLGAYDGRQGYPPDVYKRQLYVCTHVKGVRVCDLFIHEKHHPFSNDINDVRLFNYNACVHSSEAFHKTSVI